MMSKYGLEESSQDNKEGFLRGQSDNVGSYGPDETNEPCG